MPAPTKKEELKFTNQLTKVFNKFMDPVFVAMKKGGSWQAGSLEHATDSAEPNFSQTFEVLARGEKEKVATLVAHISLDAIKRHIRVDFTALVDIKNMPDATRSIIIQRADKAFKDAQWTSIPKPTADKTMLKWTLDHKMAGSETQRNAVVNLMTEWLKPLARDASYDVENFTFEAKQRYIAGIVREQLIKVAAKKRVS